MLGDFTRGEGLQLEKKATDPLTLYKVVLCLAYVKDPGEALASQAAQGIFVSWRFEDLEHHLALH